MRLKLFVKKGCPDCAIVKAHAAISALRKLPEIEFSEFDVETIEGYAEAVFYDVYSVPFLLEFKYEGDPPTGYIQGKEITKWAIELCVQKGILL